MNIVCFHLNQVGDLAFSLPALKSLRDHYVGSSITSVVRPSLIDITSGAHLVDDILVRRGGLNRSKATLIDELRRRRFDLAVVFSQSAECAILAYLSGAPRRVGFVNTSAGFLLTGKVAFNHPPSTVNNLRLVESLGCHITKPDYVGLLRATDRQRERSREILRECGVGDSDKIVAFAPGTSGRRAVKEWSDEGYTRLAHRLTADGLGVVILGTHPMEQVTRKVPSVLDLSGRTNLGEALGILDRCRTLVAVDSGILHLSAAMGKHVVGLYGPSDHRITGPQGNGHEIVTTNAECSPCIRVTCEQNRKCMSSMSADLVYEAVCRLLARESV